MARAGSATLERGNGRSGRTEGISEEETPRSISLAGTPITNSGQLGRLLSAMVSDVLTGAITEGVCNSATNACGKMLENARLQLKHGVTSVPGQPKSLKLIADDDE